MKKKALLFFLLFLYVVTLCAQTCREQKIEVQHLPSLHIPRAGSALFCVNGEYVVAGGHTSGFVPTQTAEYYKDGEWHTMQMVYNHDAGFSVVLPSGHVLLGGGSLQPIGIGQTYLAELYDPVNHSFDGFNSMQNKRSMCSALVLDSGKTVIAGNWYHDDAIEIFDGKLNFKVVKSPCQQRSIPYIIQTAPDDALIFGSRDTKGNPISSVVADCLKGDTVHISLFENWHPLSHQSRAQNNFIGNKQQGRYTYLIAAEDSTGQVAVVKADNGRFTLLPTACPIPMKSQWGLIEWSDIIADQQAEVAYLIGLNREMHDSVTIPIRYYVLSIDYGKATVQQPADIMLYYTDPMATAYEMPVLTPDGDLLWAGGMLGHSNFTPSDSVIIMRLGQQETVAANSDTPSWYVIASIVGGIVVICLLALYFWYHRSRKSVLLDSETEPENSDDLMQRLRVLMEEKKLYADPNLKVSDVAILLNTNRRILSNVIKEREGSTFILFVNKYRVAHAKHLLQHSQGMKLSSVYADSGFSNEQTFYRIFKQVTGQTPGEWKNNA